MSSSGWFYSTIVYIGILFSMSGLCLGIPYIIKLFIRGITTSDRLEDMQIQTRNMLLIITLLLIGIACMSIVLVGNLVK